MKSQDIDNGRLTPVNIDDKAWKSFLIFILVVLFFLLYWINGTNTEKKPSSTSFGSFKDFKVECTQDEYDLIVKTFDDYILNDFRANPEIIRNISPREFEELVAYLYMRKGFDVTLTPMTKDGGKDIIAIYPMPTGESVVYYVECKRYSLDNPVDVTIVRQFSGAMFNENVHIGVIATTSRFTEDARTLVQSKNYRIELKDMDDIIKLLV